MKILVKRLICICFFVLLSVFVYIYFSIKSNNTMQVNASPIANKVIVIDAGHGLPDEGAFLLHKENK